MKKNRSAYLTGFENATGHRLDVENYVGVEPALQPSSAQKRGGDMQGRSRKIESQSFVASQWRPDALVYEGVPKANAVEYMDQPTEQLYMDRLWLCLQAREHDNSTPLCPARATFTRIRAPLALPACARGHTECACMDLSRPRLAD